MTWIVDVLKVIFYGLATVIIVPVIAILIVCALDIIGSVSIITLTVVLDALDDLKRKLIKS